MITSSRNLYIDTGKVLLGNGNRGDNFEINLGNASISCKSNEKIRIHLLQFCMNKTFTDVNDTNNAFTFSNNISGNSLNIPNQNYARIYDLAVAFGTAIGNQVIADVAGITKFTLTDISPSSSSNINGTSDNIIGFTINCLNNADAPVNHGYTSLLLQSFQVKGDSAYLLGGDRIIDPLSTEPSYTITGIGGSSLTVKAFYPAVRSTMPLVYIRSNLTGNAIQSSSLSQPTGLDQLPEAFNSNILGVVSTNTEYLYYQASNERTYTLDIGQKNLSNIRIYLTDQHNRPIGRQFNQIIQTASGNGQYQSTLGNLSFSCVLGIDTVEMFQSTQNNRLQIPIQPLGDLNISYQN